VAVTLSRPDSHSFWLEQNSW